MNISKFILKKTGWVVNVNVEIPDKCVICVAPHTSNWDFIMGKLVYWSLNKQASFLVKKEWTVFPFSLVAKPMGAIAVDRKQKNSVTKQVVEYFNTKDKFQVAITPEGTRKANANWKKGFYFIARDAKVPIVLASMDYGTKQMTFGRILIPTGNIEMDMIEIKEFYKDVVGKNPANFRL